MRRSNSVKTSYRSKIINGKGFSSFKSLDNYYTDYNVPIISVKIKTDKIKDFVKFNGPYYLFFTLTFGSKMDIDQCCKYANKFIHRYNKKLFGREYYKKSDFIEGVAIIEDHKSIASRNDIHIHVLVKNNDRYDDFTLAEHKDIFYKAAVNILDDNGKPVFDKKCIDIREVRDNGVIEYCFKQIHDENLDRVRIIDKDGLSDS